MSPTHKTPANNVANISAFHADFIAGVKSIFEERIVFNKLLGLTVIELGAETSIAQIDMRPEFVGHFTYQRVHGGVISAGLDAAGALAVMGAMGARHTDEPPAKCLERFGKLGTIDLRVDYLRAGIGERFTLHAQVLRLGSRVATTRMEFRGVDGTLLSTGSAAYIVS
jgi:uncharacterized protein (TIGR00369 family)